MVLLVSYGAAPNNSEVGQTTREYLYCTHGMNESRVSIRKFKGRIIEVKPAEADIVAQSQVARGKLRRSLKLARAQAIELPKSSREAKSERWTKGDAFAQERAAGFGLTQAASKPKWKKAKEGGGRGAPYCMQSGNSCVTTSPVEKAKKGKTPKGLHLKQRAWKRQADARRQANDPYAPTAMKRKREAEQVKQAEDMTRWEQMKAGEIFLKERAAQHANNGGLPMPWVMQRTNSSMAARTQQEEIERRQAEKEAERKKLEKQRRKEEKWAAKAKAKADRRLAVTDAGRKGTFAGVGVNCVVM